MPKRIDVYDDVFKYKVEKLKKQIKKLRKSKDQKEARRVIKILISDIRNINKALK